MELRFPEAQVKQSPAPGPLQVWQELLHWSQVLVELFPYSVAGQDETQVLVESNK